MKLDTISLNRFPYYDVLQVSVGGWYITTFH